MRDFFYEDLAALRRTFSSDLTILRDNYNAATAVICSALKKGNKVLAFGNGGSASDAEHMVGELIGKFAYDRAPLPAVALTCGSAALTAIGNDYGYEHVFKRQLLGLARKGDVAIGISTSGNSPNVVAAIAAANQKGLVTVAMTGAADSALSKLAKITLRSPSTHTARIQEVHAFLIHSICRFVEEALFPEKAGNHLPADKQVRDVELTDFAQSLVSYKSVFTNGCFDIVHPGHITLLKCARSLGEMLIVGLNSDDSVRRLKGPQRPFNSFTDRAAVLSSLEMVDFIIEFDEDTPLDLIKKLTPKVLVKGGDYTRETIVGADWVESHGGRTVVIPLVPNFSTTRILQSHEKK